RASKHSRTQRLAEPARSEELERGRLLLDEILAVTACAQLRVTNDGQQTPEEVGRRVADWLLAGLSAP
ncbi:MAG: hypothetical protein M3P04_00855, partial [Actinomycetota bacterium]|nr:hypothetical protein [Actinomycetota bacterium]